MARLAHKAAQVLLEFKAFKGQAVQLVLVLQVQLGLRARLELELEVAREQLGLDRQVLQGQLEQEDQLEFKAQQEGRQELQEQLALKAMQAQ
jgi:hypothetical protein